MARRLLPLSCRRRSGVVGPSPRIEPPCDPTALAGGRSGGDPQHHVARDLSSLCNRGARARLCAHQEARRSNRVCAGLRLQSVSCRAHPAPRTAGRIRDARSALGAASVRRHAPAQVDRGVYRGVDRAGALRELLPVVFHGVPRAVGPVVRALARLADVGGDRRGVRCLRNRPVADCGRGTRASTSNSACRAAWPKLSFTAPTRSPSSWLLR